MSTHIHLIALVAGNLFAVQPPSPQVDRIPFVLTRLELAIGVDYERQAIDGSATLYLRNAGTSDALTVPLLLNRLMSVSAVRNQRGSAVPFEQDVVVFRDDSLLQVNAIVVSLAEPLRGGDSLVLVVSYAGRLTGYTETGSLYIRDHVDRDFTIIREDALAFPTLGTIMWSTNRTIVREPFAFTADISVPSSLVVATGGEQVGVQTRDTTTTYSYRSSGPVPFLNIAIAPYKVLQDRGLRIFYFPQDSAGATVIARAARGAVARYAEWYGSLDQQPQLTVIEIPEDWGSQASATGGIIQTADAFRDPGMLYQLYHELSHFWNVADLDRPSPRWNEGLASFLQWRMAEELDGWNDWDSWLSRTEASLKSRCGSNPRCPATPFSKYGEAGLTDMSYPVGAATFWLLYQALGAARFDRTYRDFLERHGKSGATSQDFVRTFGGASPVSERILSDWFVTARWYTRLASGEGLKEMLAGYRQN